MLDFLSQSKSRTAQSSKDSLDLASADLSVLRADINFPAMEQSINLGHEQADLKWKKTYYALRTIWATLSIALLGLSLCFTYWLVKGVGTGQLNFVEYKAFLNIIAGEIILNVLGLVAIVMHFLFPKDGTHKVGLKKKV